MVSKEDICVIDAERIIVKSFQKKVQTPWLELDDILRPYSWTELGYILRPYILFMRAFRMDIFWGFWCMRTQIISYAHLIGWWRKVIAMNM